MSIQTRPLYETMLRNRLEGKVHDSDGDLLDVDDGDLFAMREWLADNASGFWHEDSEISTRPVFWFEHDTDMVAFSLRFSGE